MFEPTTEEKIFNKKYCILGWMVVPKQTITQELGNTLCIGDVDREKTNGDPERRMWWGSSQIWMQPWADLASSAGDIEQTGRDTPPSDSTQTQELYSCCLVLAPSPKWLMLFPGVTLVVEGKPGRKRTDQTPWCSVVLSRLAVTQQMADLPLLPL